MASSLTASPNRAPQDGNDERVDVLIIGGGPAGSATATWLARSGFDVLLIDRARFPRDKPCAEYMSPEAVRWIDRLGGGVLAALEQAGGVEVQGTAVVGPHGGRLLGRFAGAEPPPYRPAGLSVPRRLLDWQLLEAARLAGARIGEETGALDLIPSAGGVRGARVRGPDGSARRITARLTVGADGLRSMVARRIGRRRFGRPRRVAFVAHLTGVRDMNQHAELHVSRNGYAGLNPVGGDLVNVSLVVSRDRAAAAGNGRMAEFFFHMLDGFPGVRGRLEPRHLTREILATGPFSAWSGRPVAGGALLVGDAADFFDPFTGEGICAALRGARLAADVASEALATHSSGPVPREALHPYARQRAEQFAGKWALERLIGHGMALPRLFDRAVSRIGRRAHMADTMIGVTGHVVPAWRVLNPWYLARMVF